MSAIPLPLPDPRQCIERRLPWNSGSTLRRCGCAPRDRDGGSTSHRCSARAHEEVSATRLVSIRNRNPELCRYRIDNDSFVSRSCESEDTAQTWEGLLRTSDSAWGARKRHGNRRLYILLAAGTNVLPHNFRVTEYKLWLRSLLVLGWLVLLLGIATYGRWYVPHLFRK